MNRLVAVKIVLNQPPHYYEFNILVSEGADVQSAINASGITLLSLYKNLFTATPPIVSIWGLKLDGTRLPLPKYCPVHHNDRIELNMSSRITSAQWRKLNINKQQQSQARIKN